MSVDPNVPKFSTTEAVQCKPLEVTVSERGGLERALKILKRKLSAEGVLRELKMRRHYMKPSIKIRKKQVEAARRKRKKIRMDKELSMAPKLQSGIVEA